MASNISLLAPHLGGKAYPIRSAIVTAIGHLIQRAFGPTAEGADAQGTPRSTLNPELSMLCLPVGNSQTIAGRSGDCPQRLHGLTMLHEAHMFEHPGCILQSMQG